MTDLFDFLRSGPVPAAPIANVGEFLARTPARADIGSVERAARAGFAADRLGYAFVGGYDAAVACLVPNCAGRAAVAITEDGGGHPRAIACRLEGGRLHGRKTFVTLAETADALLVLASIGKHGGRNLLRAVRIPVSREGIVLEPLERTPFAPEVPHAVVTFTRVTIEPAEVLDGDGYQAYLKPFRTIEDIHVLAAALGYLCAVARAYAWPRSALETLFSALASLVALGACEPTSRGVHIALAGTLAAARTHMDALAAHWEGTPNEVRERWRRDAPLLHVADRARAARLEAAWRASG